MFKALSHNLRSLPIGIISRLPQAGFLMLLLLLLCSVRFVSRLGCDALLVHNGAVVFAELLVVLVERHLANWCSSLLHLSMVLAFIGVDEVLLGGPTLFGKLADPLPLVRERLVDGLVVLDVLVGDGVDVIGNAVCKRCVLVHDDLGLQHTGRLELVALVLELLEMLLQLLLVGLYHLVVCRVFHWVEVV